MISLHFTYCYYFVVVNMSSGYYMESVLSGLYPYREITKLPFSFCSSPELFWSCTICWSIHLYHTIEMFNFSPEPSFSTKLDAIDFWIKDTACIQVFFSDKVKFRDEKNTLWKWAFVWENLLNYKFYTRSAMWYLGTEKHLCIT